MRKLQFILLIVILGVSANAQTSQNQPQYVRPEPAERFQNYVGNMFGPSALIGPAISSTFRQIRNRPEEWEKTGKGFAKRFGYSLGRNMINQTVTYGLDEALKLDSKYYLSNKRDFKSKLSNAMVSPFTARNSKGKRVVGIPKIVGIYSGNIVANEVWMPKRFSYKDGIREGSVSLLTRVGFNLLREFVIKK